MKKKIITTAVLLSVITGAYFLGTLHTGNREIQDNYIDTASKEFYNNYVDMEQVTGFNANNGNLYLYFKNGEGYYLELDNTEFDNNGQEDGITYGN